MRARLENASQRGLQVALDTICDLFLERIKIPAPFVSLFLQGVKNVQRCFAAAARAAFAPEALRALLGSGSWSRPSGQAFGETSSQRPNRTPCMSVCYRPETGPGRREHLCEVLF